jgi:hypothetical protein
MLIKAPESAIFSQGVEGFSPRMGKCPILMRAVREISGCIATLAACRAFFHLGSSVC